MMVELETMLEIKILHQQGHSVRHIARTLGLSRNTVKRYLQNRLEKPAYSPRAKSAGKLTAYEPYLVERQQQASPDWIPATVLYREVCDQGYRGSLSLVRQFLQTLKLPLQSVPICRFETPPGKQMQVDWAHFQTQPYRLSALIVTLGFSRFSYVEFVGDEKLNTLLACLANAFAYFGGLTQELLFDNMKTVVIKRDAYGQGQHRFHPTLWDFAKHYGFIPKLCQPYRAQTKGKVERFIRYLRESFYNPLRTSLQQVGLVVDSQTANQAVRVWLNDIANSRVHATLGERPVDLWAHEKNHLLPCPLPYVGLVTPKPMTAFSATPLLLPASITPVPAQHALSLYQTLLNDTLGETYELTA